VIGHQIKASQTNARPLNCWWYGIRHGRSECIL